jgi:hypothetical protein
MSGPDHGRPIGRQVDDEAMLAVGKVDLHAASLTTNVLNGRRPMRL